MLESQSLPVDFQGAQRLLPTHFWLSFFIEEKVMSSRTGKTRNARKVRQARKGKARKRREQTKGTTPKFPIHLGQ
jgi:hypothetical protein